MKKIILTFIIGILLTNCAKKNDEKKLRNTENVDVNDKTNLEYIDEWNQIELAHTNDKYGEWGGDTDIILVYSNGKKYYANYAKYLGSYEPPNPPKENEEPKKWYEYKKLERKIDSIELDSASLQLIEDAIIYLAKEKITKSPFPSHAGIWNRVMSRDSTIIIDDYPSNEWKLFQELKTKLNAE